MRIEIYLVTYKRGIVLCESTHTNKLAAYNYIRKLRADNYTSNIQLQMTVVDVEAWTPVALPR